MPDAVDVVAMLRRLDEAATTGPWYTKPLPGDPAASGFSQSKIVAAVCRGSGIYSSAGSIFPQDDRRLIATLRTLLPELIGVVEAAGRAAVAESYEAMSAAQDELSDRLDALAAAAEKVEVEGE